MSKQAAQSLLVCKALLHGFPAEKRSSQWIVPVNFQCVSCVRCLSVYVRIMAEIKLLKAQAAQFSKFSTSFHEVMVRQETFGGMTLRSDVKITFDLQNGWDIYGNIWKYIWKYVISRFSRGTLGSSWVYVHVFDGYGAYFISIGPFPTTSTDSAPTMPVPAVHVVGSWVLPSQLATGKHKIYVKANCKIGWVKLGKCWQRLLHTPTIYLCIYI